MPATGTRDEALKMLDVIRIARGQNNVNPSAKAKADHPAMHNKSW
jgi:hypothetical protein